MRELRSLFEELKRRKVIRTVVVYAVVAWAVLQVADVTWEHLPLPPWTMTFLIVLTILGLPLVLTLAWVFEVTSEGVRRTSEAPSETGESAPKPTPGKGSFIQPVVLGAVLLTTVGLGIWLFRSRAGGGVDPEIPIAGAAVATFPCTVRGEGLTEMGEGMVFLLSSRLRGGIDGFRPLDPRTVLSYMDRTGGGSLDAEAARSAARRLGAGRYVECDIIGLVQDHVQVNVSLYPSAGEGASIVDVTVEGRREDLPRLADELAVGILTGVGGARSRLAQEAGRATGDVPLEAWRAYVRGERAYRGGRFLEAMVEYAEAVDIDPTFALGHYRLAVAASWAERHDVRDEALDAARHQSDRLSPLDRAILEATAADFGGAHAEAERLARYVTRAYPEELEGWYRLGEVIFHTGWLRGQHPSEADSAFIRASALDPGNHHWDVLFHMSNHAGSAGDFERFDALTEQLLDLNPEGDGDYFGWARAQRLLFRGDSLAVDSLFAVIEAGSYTNLFIADLAPTPTIGERLAEGFASTSQPEANRALGLLKLASARVALGRWAEAQEALERAARLRPALALEMKAHLAVVAVPGLVEGELGAVVQELEAWDGRAPDDRESPVLFESPHGGLHPWLRLYLLGLLEARLGNTDAARERAEALARADPPPGLEEWIRDLELVIRAEAARRDGEPERALDLLEDAPLWTVYRLDERLSPLLGNFYPVLLRAELLSELDRPAEALRWYEALDTPFWTPSNAIGSRWLLGRAGVLAALGDEEGAESLREEVRERWQAADVPFPASDTPWGPS